MAKTQTLEQRRSVLGVVKGHPIRALLRPVVSGHSIERRDPAARQALMRRVYGEFLEMPGLRLSIQQAARLFNLPPNVCARLLAELIEGGFLRVTVDGQYALLNRGRQLS